MPVTRILVAQNQEENQILRVDYTKRFINNHSEEWQFLFNPNSALTSANRILKIAAEFDTSDFTSIRMAAYLYNIVSGAIDTATSCTFNIYKVETPSWTDTLLLSQSAAEIYNGYWYLDVLNSLITPTNLDGDTTLMIEAFVTRNTETFRDRIYVNHLGVYDSIFRLRNDVDFLDITKQDE